ncbi:MAG TPA: hypothetical protein VMH01_02075 [Puia sp.]|nr:hypothetical protein [Puia sp.]
MKKIKIAAIVLLGLLFVISYRKDRAAALVFSSSKSGSKQVCENNTEEDLITRMGPIMILYSGQ